MTIKKRAAKFFAAILALLIGSAVLLHAQPASTNSSTNGNDTNAVTAQGKSSVASTNVLSATNSATVAEAKHKYLLDKARVDERGSKGPAPAGIYLRNGGFVSVNPFFEKTSFAFVAILLPFILAFGLPVVIIFTVFYFRHRQSKMMHETVRAMIEKGVPVSPEMIAGLYARGSDVNIQGQLAPGMIRNRRLLPGLILTGVGVALIIALPEHSGPFGLIICFIGLAFLVAWLVERKQITNEERGNMAKEGLQTTERKHDNDQQPPKM